MARGKPMRVVTPPKPGKLSHAQPKLCPQCLNVMRMVGGVLACPKHGEPTRP